MIWQLAYELQEARVIEVKSARSDFNVNSCIPWSIQATHPPALLHVSRESREYFLNSKKCFTSPFSESLCLSQSCQNMSIRHLLFDPQKDVLFLNLGSRLTIPAVNDKSLRQILAILFGDDREQVVGSIRKFAAPITAWKRWFGWLDTRLEEIQQVKLFFPNLKLAIQDILDMIGGLEEAEKARLVRFQRVPAANTLGQVAFYNVADVERGLPRWELAEFQLMLP